MSFDHEYQDEQFDAKKEMGDARLFEENEAHNSRIELMRNLRRAGEGFGPDEGYEETEAEREARYRANPWLA